MSSHSSLICRPYYQRTPTYSSTPTSSAACRSLCRVLWSAKVSFPLVSLPKLPPCCPTRRWRPPFWSTRPCRCRRRRLRSSPRRGRPMAVASLALLAALAAALRQPPSAARPGHPRLGRLAASYRSRRCRPPTASTTTTSAVELAVASLPAAGIRKTSDCPAGHTHFAVAVRGSPHLSQGQCFPHKLSCRHWRRHQSHPFQFFFISNRPCNSKC